jgi:cysteine desulfurase/selenocysteine lyase
MEHHSNIVPWQMAAERSGAEVRTIPITDEGEIDMDAYGRLLGQGRVKLVAIVHVSNSLGTVNPIAEMVAMAHTVGALVLVDGAQAVCHMPVDVHQLAADFYVFSAHKMLGPTGVGVLYGRFELLERMPAYQGGGDMIRTVDIEAGTSYAPLPAKFEAGTPNIGGVIGLGAAIEFLEDLVSTDEAGRGSLAATFSWIGERERELLSYATERLSAIPGIKIVGLAPKKSAIISFVLDGAHPHDVGTILDAEGIAVRTGHHCCMPVMQRYGLAATARASFLFYNIREEIDRLADGLIKVKEIFAL